MTAEGLVSGDTHVVRVRGHHVGDVDFLTGRPVGAPVRGYTAHELEARGEGRAVSVRSWSAKSETTRLRLGGAAADCTGRRGNDRDRTIRGSAGAPG